MSSPDSQADNKVLYPTTVAALAFAGFFALSLLPRMLPSRQSALIGKPAPEFALEVAYNGDAGSRMRLADLQGRTVILDFWASWCGPCQIEAPILERLSKRHQNDGVVVVGINTNDQPGMAAAFARQKHLTYPILYDRDSSVAEQYHVEGLPTLVIIDASGNVSAVRSGVEGDADLDRLVADSRR